MPGGKKPTYDFLSIAFDVAPCEAHCFHCSSDVRKKKAVWDVPLEALLATAERYLKHRGSLYERIGLLVLDVPLNYPSIVGFMEYAYGIGAVAGIVVNGAAFGDYGPTLRALKDVGEDAIQISLYGVGKTHDRLAGRRGDFDLLNRVAEDAVEAGLGLYFRIFVTKGNLNELDAVDSYVRRFGEAVRKAWFDLWGMAGRGSRAEGLRIDEADRETITVKLPAGCLSEREIIAKLDAGEVDASYFVPRYNMLSFTVGENGVRTFEHTGREAEVPNGVADDEGLLKYLSRKKEGETAQISRTPDLVAEYGDIGNRRLYTPGGYRQLIFRRAGIC